MKRNLWNKPFTDAEIERIRELLKIHGDSPALVADKFNVRVKEINAVEKSMHAVTGSTWSRAKQLINVGEAHAKPRLMSISEIAAMAHVSRTTIYMRLYRGVTGPMLLSRTHCLPRIKKGTIAERLGRIRKVRDLT